jgi:hypothetical protein
MSIKVRRSRRILYDTWEAADFKQRYALNRHMVEIMDAVNQDVCIDADILIILMKWCDENLDGMYFCTQDFFCFEIESDMVAFKAYWHGQEID